MADKCKILIIVPAYNEEESILGVIEDLRRNASSSDLIVINDGSTDGTCRILDEYNIPHIDLIENLGIGGAVQTGYKYALQQDYDIAVQFDGDGQHSAQYISKLVAPIEAGKADLVVGSRFKDEKTDGFRSSFMRRVGIRILSNVLKMASTNKIEDVTSGFRAADKKAISLFASYYPDDYPEPESLALVARKGLRACEVPVEMKERMGGESSITRMDSVYYMIKVTIAILIQTNIYERHSS